MKKYFIYKEGSQQGPFDLEELKLGGLTKDSMVWYEGCSGWIVAKDVPEIKAALFTPPPPFVPPPPKTDINRLQETSFRIAEQSSSSGKTMRTLAITVLVIIIGIAVLKVLNYPSDNSFVHVTVNPPNPRLMESHVAEDPSSRIFAFREGVWATILNQGGSGKVLVSAQLVQGAETYNRSHEIFLNANQSQEFHFVFTEARALGGNMTYNVSVKAL